MERTIEILNNSCGCHNVLDSNISSMLTCNVLKMEGFSLIVRKNILRFLKTWKQNIGMAAFNTQWTLETQEFLFETLTRLAELF